MKTTNKENFLKKTIKVILFGLENVNEILEIRRVLKDTKDFDLVIQGKITDKFIDGMDKYLENCIQEVMEQEKNNKK